MNARSLLAALLPAALLLLASVTLALTRGFSHDEHQHIAAGALVAREGLWPFRDFAFFHMPYLPFIYGALFHLSDHLLLVARLFSALCAAATGFAVWFVARRLFSERGGWSRTLVPLGAVLLFVTARQFTHSAGRAWNQEPALLCAVLSFLCYDAAFRGLRPGRWVFGAAFLLGLSIGLRITFAPLAGALALMLLFAPPPGLRWRHFVNAFAGGTLALVPVLALFAAEPEAFWFGNWEFAKINVLYREATGHPRTMTLPKKLRFLFKEVIRPNWPLVLAFALPIITTVLAAHRSRSPRPSGVKLVLLAFPFLLAGSLAPSPVFEQYFFPFIPFLLLGGLYAFAATPPSRLVKGLLAACVAASLVLGAGRYKDLPRLATPEKWVPMKIHANSQVIATATAPGARILTLAPTAVLEAGRRIYPSLATGPFAWRVTPFVSTEKRERLDLTGPDELAALLRADPPAACLTGSEPDYEAPILAYGEAHAASTLKVAKEAKLWLTPR